MTTQILNSVKSIVKLNQEEEEAFLATLEVKHLKKKELLQQEGKVCNHISFINSGSMRIFQNKDGEDNTIQFFFQDGWYTDYSSFLTGLPSFENMQALEPCEIVQFSKKNTYELYERYPVFNKLGRIMAENAFRSISRLNHMLKSQEPEQRYLSLIENRPEVVDRIPQHYIASYLGIKPESLSRIRKRILDSRKKI